MNEERMQIRRLNRLYKEESSIYSAYAARCGESDTTLWILYALYTGETPCTQNTLCEGWYYSKQTIHSSVAAMAQRGLVRLQRVQGIRGKQVALTEDGMQLCERIIRPLIEAEKRAFLRFTREERERVIMDFERANAWLRGELERMV